MRRAAFNAMMGSLSLVASTWPSVGQAAPDREAKSASHLVDFRGDDLEAQRIARKMLRKEIAETVPEEADMPSEFRSSLRTAWANVSHAEVPMLLVTYGCSPTGNCDLYGFERATSGWKLVLNSIAQTCSILSSSHGGRRDISAYVHGSATEGTIKTYWWRRNRYVRVSERNVVYR